MTDHLEARLADLAGRIDSLGSLVVAFSGGADSAFLLAAAVRTLGPGRVLAATSTSAALASGEWEAAHSFARSLGVEHIAVTTDELQRPGYVANGPDRCYHCKAELTEVLTDLAERRGFAVVATGTNADDLREPHRPGLRAAEENDVATPLADAGLTKADVREASRRWGLPTWDKPQAACLASRVAYGVSVDADRLARIDAAESAARSALTDAGITVTNLRVRDLGDRARIEVDAPCVVRKVWTSAVIAGVVASGFPWPRSTHGVPAPGC
ncbi:MAG: ATP-dependent sacrificial sulfur transferase LarE [Candidatus Nanopelagicales bacterium]